MGVSRELIHDEISRTLKDDNGASVGKIKIHLSYYEEFDDGMPEEGSDNPVPRYIPEPFSRTNEHYTVTVEGPKGSVESETVYTGAAMEQIVELFARLEPNNKRR